jgi:parvulin-like peptidyl-prolyl isomerase
MLKFLRGGKRTAAIWWMVIFGTAISFIIGFSVAPNLVGTSEVSGSTVLGTVGGEPVTQEEWQAKYAELAQTFRLQRGADPERRDEAQMREQAWLQLLTEKAVLQEGERLGFAASDSEVVFAIRNTPPPIVRTMPAFQTNGRFEPQKYFAALQDPEVNWSPLEEEMRRSLPGQKLEERLIASAKFSEPELRRAFRDQYERATVTVARWLESPQPVDTTMFTEEVLRRYHTEHPAQFSGPEEASATVVILPKTLTDDDKAQTRERAQAITDQARGGADFAQLARDMSEAPDAARGGELGRNISLAELPPSVAGPVGAVADSAILDPILEGTRYYVLKVRRVAGAPAPTFSMSEVMLNVTPSEASRTADFEKLERLRKQAKRKDLGHAAAAMGLAAQETGWFTFNYFVPQLAQLPQAQQFAMLAKKGATSPAYDAEQSWLVLQVKDKRGAGLRPFESVRSQVLEAAIRSEKLKPAHAAAARSLERTRSGMPFDQAARAESAAAVEQTQPFTRQSPANQLASSPRVVGVAFGLPIGQAGGPFETPAGVLLVRKDAFESAPESRFDSLKAGVSQLLLSNRRQRGVAAWLDWLRESVGVKDLRGEKLVVQ